MSVDLSEFVALSKPRRVECTMSKALRELKPAKRAQLTAALAEDGITNAAISAWLAQHEIKVTAPTVSRHRRKDCACG